LWLHSLKVAQLLRSAACLHTNQSRSYLNHLVEISLQDHTESVISEYLVSFEKLLLTVMQLSLNNHAVKK